MAYESSNRGTHSELVAMTALLAAGYEVAEPVAAESYDIVAKEAGTGEWRTFQVKTLRLRTDKGRPYYVLNGTRNSGDVYRRADADYFIGVVDGAVYLVENTEQSEYWAAVDGVDGKWRRLAVNMNEAEAV